MPRSFCRIGKDAFNDDDFPRFDVDCFRLAGASQIGISGLFDALTFAQHGYVFGQKPPVEGVRVVEINVLPFFYGYMAAVFVVGVLR